MVETPGPKQKAEGARAEGSQTDVTMLSYLASWSLVTWGPPVTFTLQHFDVVSIRPAHAVVVM